MRARRRFLALGLWIGGNAIAAAPEPLDLNSLLAEAERANPQLLASRARADAAAERPGQLETLPDPLLSTSYTNDGLSSFTLGSSKFSNVTVRWDQDVPYRSARGSKAEVARADTEVTLAASVARAARVRAAVIASYAQVWRADRTRELLEEGRGLLATGLAVARARYEAGSGIEETLLRAQNEIRRLDLELLENARLRRSAEIALGVALGRAGDPEFAAAAGLPEGGLPSDPVSPADAVSPSAPEIAAARAEEIRANAGVEDARANAKPELGWMAAYQYLGGLDPMVTAGMTVRLPLWKDRKQARAVAEAEHTATAMRLEREAAVVAVRSRAAELASEVATLERELALYEGALIPQDAAAADAARAAQSAGRAEMSLVLDDMGRWLADSRAAVDLKARRVAALAALEAATGAPLLAASASGGAR